MNIRQHLRPGSPPSLRAPAGRSTAPPLWLTVAAIAAAFAPGAAAQTQTGYDMRAVVPEGSPFHGVHGLRFDAQGRLHAASVIGQSIFTVDVDTGAVERLIGPPEGMADDIAFAADGTMVWSAIEDGVLYVKPPEGPIRRRLEDVKGVNAVAFDPAGERLFFTLVFYGDALYELDVASDAPPRLIAENLGGLNAFGVADNGMIYGPLVFGGAVVEVDPGNGEVRVVSDRFESPGALKLDGRGSAYVHDGDVIRQVELATGDTDVIAELPSEADNLALDAEGRLFVSLAEENAIVEVDVDTGEVEYVVGPSALNSPAGLAAVPGAAGTTLYVGDTFGGIRIVETPTGRVEHTPVDMFQPTHVAVRGQHLIASNEVFGDVQRLDRDTFEVLEQWSGFERPSDVLEAPDGSLIVAETGTGRLLHVTGTGSEDRRVIVADLASPRGLAWAEDGGSVYLTEADGGRLLKIAVASGDTEILATGLRRPEGVAADAEGRAVVVEVGAKRIRRFSSDGSSTLIASDLPVGLSVGPSLYRGVAVGGSAIFFSSDIDNTIYELTPSE
ncbi:MAG: SMP-30/gluconolactonase/LRE family protein [Gammaproteobacteria bacterium]|nr:SMP-30/gluconolactonase/LRE family protein [Gammaproteobacteria bacterium]